MSFRYALPALWLSAYSAAAQTAIQYGTTIAGALDCAQSNAYSLTATKGDKLVVHATEVADFGGICFNVAACAFELCVEVRDENNDLVGMACAPTESNACGHQLRTQLGPLMLPRDGKYTIVVREADIYGRGTYALSVQRTNSPFRADMLNMGEPRLVPVQTAGEVKTFTFNAAEGNNLSLELKAQAGGVAPRLALYAPNGDPVALPESGLIQYTVRQGGTHTLLVFSAVNETGTAQLTLRLGPLYPNTVISQVADGNGWRTTLNLVNHSSEPAPFTVRSWTSAGAPWRLAWDGSPEGTIPVGGSQTINTLNRDSVTSQGWAELVTSKAIGVQAIFRAASRQEAAVAGTSTTNRFLLPFDNTQDMVTSMAVVNTNDSRAIVVTVNLRDETGRSLGTEVLALPSRGHDAFSLPARFPAIRGQRGVAEFSTEAPDITALGLRFSPSGAFTSFPVQPGLR
jgi:hypothetical protein